MDRGMPEQLWAHYIEQLNTAHRIAVEDSVLLVFLLKIFIHALKAPKSFPKGKTSCESLGCGTLEKSGIHASTILFLNENSPAVYLCVIFFLLIHADDQWWNPEQLEEDSRNYLHLLIGLFELILDGAEATHFRVLMKVFIKVKESSSQNIILPLRGHCR